MISVAYLCRCAQRRYMRRSISAQSVASVPPAPAVMVRIASFSSYSPENISDVRKPVYVIKDGKLFESRAVYAALGVN